MWLQPSVGCHDETASMLAFIAGRHSSKAELTASAKFDLQRPIPFLAS